MDLDHTVLDKENSTYGFLNSGLQPRASPPVQRCPEADWLSRGEERACSTDRPALSKPFDCSVGCTRHSLSSGLSQSSSGALERSQGPVYQIRRTPGRSGETSLGSGEGEGLFSFKEVMLPVFSVQPNSQLAS